MKMVQRARWPFNLPARDFLPVWGGEAARKQERRRRVPLDSTPFPRRWASPISSDEYLGQIATLTGKLGQMLGAGPRPIHS